jgi:hypothetical protein
MISEEINIFVAWFSNSELNQCHHHRTKHLRNSTVKQSLSLDIDVIDIVCNILPMQRVQSLLNHILIQN